MHTLQREGDAHAPERRGCTRSREKGMHTLKREGDAHAPERRGCKRSREKGLQTLKRRRNGEEHVQALCALGNHLKRGDGESEGGKGDRGVIYMA